MNTLILINTLEAVLEAAGYADKTLWARVLIDQVRQSPPDCALVGIIFRRLPLPVAADVIGAMNQEQAALCYARLVAFGMTEDEIKRLMPKKGNDHVHAG